MPTSVSILWRRLNQPGTEVACIREAHDGHRLMGAAVFEEEGVPFVLRYEVRCDLSWATRSLRLTGRRAGEIIGVSVTADERRRWFLNGDEVPAVAGCIDLDLSFSAATNLIPLRRLSLAVGQRAEITSALLTLPGLRLEPLPQTYRRTGESCYAYEAPRQNFLTELEVHESGFVTHYPPLWIGNILPPEGGPLVI